ncbi:MAG: SGNH/GDSL hydrolase family protein [Verrucomicrobiaceae bacterium]
MRTQFSFCLTLTALLSINLFAAEKATFIQNLDAGKTQTIITYGTSLTAAGAWVNQLGAELEKRFPGRAKIINSAESGMWSKWGVDNLYKRVVEKTPDTVIIEFAINDAFLKYATTVDQARQNLENMIERINKARPASEIILMTMNVPIGEHFTKRPKIEDYYEMYRDVAKHRHFLLIDHEPNWHKVLKQGETDYKKFVPDGIHPNAEGCGKIILPELMSALGLSPAPHAAAPGL